MERLSLSRLGTVAVVAGTLLFGWALGGVAAVDRQLESAAAVSTSTSHDCPPRHDRDPRAL